MTLQTENETPMGRVRMTSENNAAPSPVNAEKLILTRSGTISNTGFLQMFFVTSGTGEILLEGENHTLKRGHLILLDAMKKLDYKPASPLILYSCSFTLSLFGLTDGPACRMGDLSGLVFLDEFFSSCDVPSPVYRIPGKCYELFRDVFLKMIELTENPSPVYRSLMRIYVAEVFTRLAEAFSPDNRFILLGDSDFIENITAYIHSHYSEKITYDTLSQIALISRSKLIRLFEEEMGCSVKDYIRKIRIRQACILLAETSKNVYDIMLDVGFSDMKMFCRYFKEHTNVTPSEYRNQNKTKSRGGQQF